MADFVDMVHDIADQHLERSIAAARVPVARGKPGECEGCLDDHPRLVTVGGMDLCPRCRDKRERRR